MHTTQDTEDCKLSIRLLANDDIVVVPDASSVDEHWSQYVNRPHTHTHPYTHAHPGFKPGH